MKARIRAEWAKTESGRRTLEHMRRCDLIQYVNGPQGLVLVAPKGLIESVVTPMKMPGGETIMMPGFRINDEYPVPPVLPPETIVETIPETIPEKPETEPDAAELRAFLEPVVAANEKFVALWKQGKIGPLIGAAMRAAAGKYEGKHIEKTLKEIVGGTATV
jgi:GatB domain